MRPFRPLQVPALDINRKGCEEFEVPTTRSLDVEIGCGAGLHPIRYATLHPHRYLVAIEHTEERFARFEQRYRNHPELADRILPVHANAVSWVTHRLPEACVDRYFLLYPNPFPKKSDLNKRWYAMPFMERILWTMKPGAIFTLATNEEFYFREAHTYFSEVWKLKPVDGPEYPASYYPRTHFEKKYSLRGEQLWNGCFQKI